MLSRDLRILDVLGPASLAYTAAKDKQRGASSRWKARSDAQACPLTYTHTHTKQDKHRDTCTETYTQTHTQTNTQMHPQTRTHTHTHK